MALTSMHAHTLTPHGMHTHPWTRRLTGAHTWAHIHSHGVRSSTRSRAHTHTPPTRWSQDSRTGPPSGTEALHPPVLTESIWVTPGASPAGPQGPWSDRPAGGGCGPGFPGLPSCFCFCLSAPPRGAWGRGGCWRLSLGAARRASACLGPCVSLSWGRDGCASQRGPGWPAGHVRLFPSPPLSRGHRAGGGWPHSGSMVGRPGVPVGAGRPHPWLLPRPPGDSGRVTQCGPP